MTNEARIQKAEAIAAAVKTIAIQPSANVWSKGDIVRVYIDGGRRCSTKYGYVAINQDGTVDCGNTRGCISGQIATMVAEIEAAEKAAAEKAAAEKAAAEKAAAEKAEAEKAEETETTEATAEATTEAEGMTGTEKQVKWAVAIRAELEPGWARLTRLAIKAYCKDDATRFKAFAARVNELGMQQSIARVLIDTQTDAAWWIDHQDEGNIVKALVAEFGRLGL